MGSPEAVEVRAPHAAGRARRALFGAALVLVGIVVVEVLSYFGAVPLTPIGWPSLGAILASAIAGVSALVGGAVLRLLLPVRRVGFLAVRGRWVDVVLLAGSGLALAVIALAIPSH